MTTRVAPVLSGDRRSCNVNRGNRVMVRVRHDHVTTAMLPLAAQLECEQSRLVASRPCLADSLAVSSGCNSIHSLANRDLCTYLVFVSSVFVNRCP